MEDVVALALLRPMYTVGEAARWAKTTPQTARRWVLGYHYGVSDKRRWSPPVTQHKPDEPFLTFQDITEVRTVARIRRLGIPLRRIREAIDFARSQLGIDRPLLSHRFLTDGRQLFMRDDTTTPNYIALNRFGQMAWSELELAMQDADYESIGDDMVAVRFWPAGRGVPILIDPMVNFGRPIAEPVGVRTETLSDRWSAGATIADLADEYSTTADVIEQAVRFESRPGAIAA
jgi:uncharacterized protein (DUF433 family)